jgi:hypothetical protein
MARQICHGMGTGEGYPLLGSPRREKDSPKYKQRPKWDFGPTSVILCHNSVGAVAFVETKCVLKVKLLSVPKGPVQDTSNRRLSFSPHVEFIPECFGTVTTGVDEYAENIQLAPSRKVQLLQVQPQTDQQEQRIYLPTGPLLSSSVAGSSTHLFTRASPS